MAENVKEYLEGSPAQGLKDDAKLPDIRRYLALATERDRDGAQYAYHVGRVLLARRKKQKHGKVAAWEQQLAESLKLAPRTIRLYCQIAKVFSDAELAAALPISILDRPLRDVPLAIRNHKDGKDFWAETKRDDPTEEQLQTRWIKAATRILKDAAGMEREFRDRALQWLVANAQAEIGTVSKVITIARKPLADDTTAANVEEQGVGGLDIDGTRMPSEGERVFQARPAVEGLGILNLGAQDERVETRGRHPANVIVASPAIPALVDDAGKETPTKVFRQVKWLPAVPWIGEKLPESATQQTQGTPLDSSPAATPD